MNSSKQPKLQKDLYQILEISATANDKEITKAYHSLALKYHPDRNGGNEEAGERFKEIQSAYEILSDPQKRKQYDLEKQIYGKPVYTPRAPTFYNQQDYKKTSSENTSQFNLPVAAIFTDQPIRTRDDKEIAEVVLFGTAKAKKTAFVNNLFEGDESTYPLGIALRQLKLNQLTFQIADLPGQERFNVLPSSFFCHASVLLIFDKLKNYKSNAFIDLLAVSQVYPLTYTGKTCELNAPMSYDKFKRNSFPKMISFEREKAHLLSLSLFTLLEARLIAKKLQADKNKGNDFVALDPPSPGRRYGCC